jgi:hypothetical protein
MADKSYVTLEQNLCVVCLTDFDTGTLLLDKRMKPRFEKFTRTGWGMCPACQKKRDDGYIALIECDPAKTKVSGDRIKDNSDAYRTGNIVHIKREAFEKVFTMAVPEKMVAYVEPAVIEMLKKMSPTPEEKNDGNADNQ